MTVHRSRHQAPRAGTEPPSDVSSWRRRQVLEAGLTAELAGEVASDARFDLHLLLQLIDKGCPPDLAARIVSPLPRDPLP